MHHKGRHQDGIHRRSRNAQRNHRNKAATGRCRVPGLGRNHAIRVALAKFIGIFGTALGLIIGQKVRDRTPSTRKSTNKHTNKRGAHQIDRMHQNFTHDRPGLEFDDIGNKRITAWAFAMILELPHQLTDGKDPDQNHKERQTRHQDRRLKCQTRLAHHRVGANGRKTKANHPGNQPAHQRIAHKACDNGQRKDDQREIFPRAKLDRNHRKRRGRNDQNDGRNDSPEEGRPDTKRKGASRFTTARHRIGIKGGCD